MEFTGQYHLEAGVFIARVFLGILFFFQGYDAVFNVKIKNVINAYREDFTGKGIPLFIVALAAWFTSCTELIGGIFLILGLFKFSALYLLGANLIIAGIGFGINTPMWDTRHVFPRLALLILLLLLPAAWDVWSIDNLIHL